MKTLQEYLNESILEGKKVSADDAIMVLKTFGEVATPIKYNGRDVTTGYVHKGETIRFCGSNFTALCDCQYSDFQSKMDDYDILMFHVFVKDSKGTPTLMSCSLEADNAIWWPADGWDEGKPDKELKKLAKDAGLTLEWDGNVVTIK